MTEKEVAELRRRFKADRETACPPPLRNAPIRAFSRSLPRSSRVANATKFSSNADQAQRPRLFSALGGYNKRYSQRF